MKKKVIIFYATAIFLVMTMVGCTLKDMNVKVGEATTDKNVKTAESMKLVD